MPEAGRLTREKYGYSMPVDAPLFCKPPIYYKNAEAIAFAYETDEDSAADILPEGLELTSPPTASVLFLRYPFSTLGVYDEVILGLSCTWQGSPRFYIAHIVVNSDVPLAAGREIWGYPKKFAEITFQKERDLILGAMERPKDNRICTGVIRPEAPLELVEGEPVPSLSLRVIPGAEEGAAPSVMELIEVPPQSTTIEAWQGSGSLQFDSTSDLDPWHKIEVRQMLTAIYRRYDFVLNYGRVIKRY